MGDHPMGRTNLQILLRVHLSCPTMAGGRYLTTKDISVIALFSGIWAILNLAISPFIWQVTHLPFTCDLIGFASLIVAIHITRKPGMGSAIGLVSTLLTLFLRPDALYFFGFTIGSITFDVFSIAVGYETFFDRKAVSLLTILIVSAASATLAGLVIGRLFMALGDIVSILTFSALHGIGGIMAAIIGYPVVGALRRKGI